MPVEAKNLESIQVLVRSRTPAYFSGDGVDATFETRIIGCTDTYLSLLNRVPPTFISPVTKSHKFFLQCQMYKFEAGEIDTDGVNIHFPIKGLSSLEGTRLAERFPFAKEEKVVCQFTNPFDQETIITKRVIDMSATGLSIRTPSDGKLFQAGLHIPELKVLIDGRPYARSSARVVYSRRLLDFSGSMRLQVGLQFLSEISDQ